MVLLSFHCSPWDPAPLFFYETLLMHVWPYMANQRRTAVTQWERDFRLEKFFNNKSMTNKLRRRFWIENMPYSEICQESVRFRAGVSNHWPLRFHKASKVFILKGTVHPKIKFCHHLLTYGSKANFFILWTTTGEFWRLATLSHTIKLGEVKN